jgi:hypothetical protein
MNSSPQIGIFVALLAIYGVTLYVAQSPISQNRRRRYAFYAALNALALGAVVALGLTKLKTLPADLGVAIFLGCLAFAFAIMVSRILFVAVWTGRYLARGVIYDRQVNPDMYTFALTSMTALLMGIVLLWIWAVSHAIG